MTAELKPGSDEGSARNEGERGRRIRRSFVLVLVAVLTSFFVACGDCLHFP